MKPVLTVVDYEAWEKGYMPPSEHILIDQLAYRGARVVMSFDLGEPGAIWLVTRGDKVLSREARRKIMELMNDALDLKLGTGSESAPGLAQCDTEPPARELSASSAPNET